MKQRPAYFHYQLIDFLLSIICSGHPIDMKRQHILAEAAKTGFI
jgi:hypothetical protein